MQYAHTQNIFSFLYHTHVIERHKAEFFIQRTRAHVFGLHLQQIARCGKIFEYIGEKLTAKPLRTVLTADVQLVKEHANPARLLRVVKTDYAVARNVSVLFKDKAFAQVAL